MKKTIQDERVVAQTRKFLSYGFLFLFFALLIALLVQQVMDVPLAQYAVEFFLFLGASIYILICSLKVGNFPIYSKKLFIIGGLVDGTIASILIGIAMYSEMNGNTMKFCLFLLFNFIAFTGLSFLLVWLLLSINKKKQDKIMANLDNEENI